MQLVTLLGEPGVGKSRMIGELFAHLDDQPSWSTWRQGRCLPYGEGVTFWALGEIVKAQAGILESDDAGTARAKLAACVEGLVEDAAEHEWLRARLAPLVGLADPQPDAGRADGGLQRVAPLPRGDRVDPPARDRDRGPALGAPSMVEFVEHVLEWSTGFPMLIVCTARPEMLQRDPRWGGGMRNSVMVSLAPLSDGETLLLLDNVLPRGHRPDVRELIAERAGGNPLFAEEFARMLDERLGPAGAGRRRDPVDQRAREPAGHHRGAARHAGRRAEVARAGRVGDRAGVLALGGRRGRRDRSARPSASGSTSWRTASSSGRPRLVDRRETPSTRSRTR